MFALPLLGSNALQSLNGTANAAWVSHALGPQALTATSNANIILFLMLGAAFGLSMAANMLIAQAVGAGDRELAKRVTGSATGFFIVLSLSIGFGGYALTPGILRLVQTPADAFQSAVTYLRVIFLALPFMFFFAFLMGAQRGVGDSRTPFYFSVFAIAMDVVLNPVLIMGLGPAPRLGIAGSALSTLSSQTISLIAMLVFLYRRDSILMIRPRDWRLWIPDLRIVRTLVTKGVPVALQMAVVSGAAVAMISLVNRYGSHTAAAYGAASQLWTYVQMPAMALGAAVSSMAAQNVGAGKFDRVDRTAAAGAIYALMLTAAPVLLLYVLGPWAFRLFLPADSASLPIALHLNRIVLWGFLPFGAAFVLAGVIRATGAVMPPLIGIVISLWLIRIPFAKLLEPYLGADAIWWSFPLGSVVSVLLALTYYRWGGWRRARLLDAVSKRRSAPPAEAPAE
jgi:putative MATE family efflux protein